MIALAPMKYVDYYAKLTDEDARVRYLMMLKERRDVSRDVEAGRALDELAQLWVSERWSG